MSLYILGFLFAFQALAVNGQEIGRVVIGVHPSEVNNTNLPITDSYVFSKNDNNAQIPIYIEVFNGTSSADIIDNVDITCVHGTTDPGYSQVTFPAIQLGSGTSYQEVTLTRLDAEGRAVNLHCYGISQAPAGDPQFQKDTSVSNIVSLTVTKPPTVSICSTPVIVEDKATDQNFTVELSEAVKDNNVVITCTPTRQPGEILLTIPLRTVQPGAKVVEVTYQKTGGSTAVTVTCVAQSVGGTQYDKDNSQGTTGTFQLQATRTARLLPEKTEIYSTAFEAIFVLDAPASVAGIVSCAAIVMNSSSQADEAVTSPLCSAATQTTQPATAGTTPAPATPAPTTVDSNATTTQSSNVITTPIPIVTDWGVREPIFTMNKDDVFKVVEVSRNREAVVTVHELVVVTCCISEWNVTAAMLAVSFIQPNFTTNWTSATDPADATTDTPITNPAFVEVAPCPCDLTVGDCDKGCCCDGDCSEDQKKVFSSCIPGLEGGQSAPLPTYNCYSNPFHKEDYFTMMCVEREYNALLGFYYTAENGLRTASALDTRLASEDVGYSYRESDDRTMTDPGALVQGYKHGVSLKTGKPSTTGSSLDSQGILVLPQKILSGMCLTTAPVRYLIDLDSDCTYQMSVDLCSEDSILSALFYVQASTAMTPHCPKSYSVLEQDGTQVIAETQVNYLCSSDVADYIFAVGSPVNSHLANESVKFNYSLPTEECMDMFGNDICVDANSIADEAVGESLPLHCSWDDGYTKPRVPTRNQVSGQCENSVLDVRYNIQWNGTKILLLTADVIMGNIPLQNVNGGATMLTQKYKASFTHAASLNQNGSTETTPRSGNPGYDFGSPIFSGSAVFANDSTFWFINQNRSRQAAVWKTGSDGYCFYAGRQEINFGEDTLSTCYLQLNLADLYNCDQLRRLVTNRLNALMPSDRLGRFGFNDEFDATNYWVEIFRENLTDAFTRPDPVLPEEIAPIDYVTGVCSNMTSGIHLDIMYAETGRANNVSIYEIIGGHINYTLSEWRLRCPNANPLACTQTDFTERFELSSSVRFIKVPAQTPTPVIRYWEGYKDICRFDFCWKSAIYPLNHEYTTESHEYVLAMVLVTILFLFSYLLVTRPWW